MPNELRVLRFGIDEAEKALRAIAQRIDCDLPDEPLISAKADPTCDKPSTVFLTGAAGKTCSVPNGHLAAGLIYYCRMIGVDVANDGKKEIYIAPDYVELRTTLRHRVMNGQRANSESVEV